MRILLQYRTRHKVVTGMYRERMRYDCVSAVTQDWTLRRNGIVSWANAISVRTVATVGHTSASAVLWAVSLAAGKVVTTCPEETAVCF